MCPVCSENVGISWQSLAVHVRTKHGPAHEHLLAMCDSPKAGLRQRAGFGVEENACK